jgi:hypothetical protein
MLYLFDDYTLDTQLYELRHAGALCPLEPQVFAVLCYLIAHRSALSPARNSWSTSGRSGLSVRPRWTTE